MRAEASAEPGPGSIARAAVTRAATTGTAVAVARILLVASLAVVLAGCLAVPGSVDGPIAVPLHITPTATSIEVDAPGWFSDETAIYLCPTAPPVLPEDAADRVGWAPGAPCQAFGTVPSPDGLRASLPLDGIDGPVRPAFAASGEWHLLLLDLEGDRVSSAIRSAFDAPPAFAAP